MPTSDKTLDEQIEQAMAQLSGEGEDARDFLKSWRLTNPKEFNAKADAVLAEVKALPRSMLPLNARQAIDEGVRAVMQELWPNLPSSKQLGERIESASAEVRRLTKVAKRKASAR